MKVIIALFFSAAITWAQDTVGGLPYERLETREATELRMLSKLLPGRAEWGTWHSLVAFPYAGHGQDDLETVLAPESELTRCRAGGPGPDFSRVFVGKNGSEARWEDRGLGTDRMIAFDTLEDDELRNNAVAYVHGTVTVDEPRTLELTCGSDDGLRLWLNGKLIVDKDVPRGLNATDDAITLDLVTGVNHLFGKVSQGGGGWAFQINAEEQLDPLVETELEYYLERDFPFDETRRHYAVTTVPVPEDVVLEVGGLDFLADGTPVVATRRGDVWFVCDAYGSPATGASYERFASGLHEPLGVGVRTEELGEAVYSVQRSELTRMLDTNGDGRADRYDCVSDGWGVSGNYHEFAFGPEFDDDGNLWVTLNVGFCGALGKSVTQWRGWALKIGSDGTVTPICDGLRSPNGIGKAIDGQMFYVDNQGDYVATNRLGHLAPGKWHGHPAGLRWRDDLENPEDRPPLEPPAVWFPYRKMGQSAADVAYAQEDGRFGPFDGQLFIGDQTRASVMRVFLEQVEGHYQGAAFPFVEGLQCGVNRVAFAPDGSMFVGQTDRGWGSVGSKPYGLQRIAYTGETPFEVLALRARHDGFELELTDGIDLPTALDPASYAVQSYTYEYHAAYGAPEDDTRAHVVTSVAQVGPRRVRLTLDAMRAGYVYEFALAGLRSEDGAPLLHDEAFYTLAKVPADPDARPRKVLFLTHSAGFVHGVVRRPEPDVLAHAEEALVEAAAGRFEVEATQDCGRVTAESLAGFDAVCFYTTGELPMPEADRVALMDWIRGGGAFVGVHCASDTFFEWAPYLDMVGGTFDGHPWHMEVDLAVEDPGHPATDHLGDTLTITDEIYQFRDWRRYPLHVLLSLAGTKADLAKGKRADRDNAVSWCKPYGEGRVFYTGLGHRPEVWENELFLSHLLDGIDWAIDGPDPSPAPPADATPLGDPGAWGHRNGAVEAAWRPVDGALEVVPGTTDLVSKATHGDALIHVEFMTPTGSPEGRGNSGVYLQGRYEVQVLDSHGRAPAPGECAGLYALKGADLDASRPPGQWQAYDIEFRAARFDAGGSKTANARVSVWWNGILVHDDVELPGPTPGGLGQDEVPLGPLLLQDHGNPVRYRNLWWLPR